VRAVVRVYSRAEAASLSPKSLFRSFIAHGFS
jgi:hypothetical protein